jgi:hypothetical protein
MSTANRPLSTATKKTAITKRVVTASALMLTISPFDFKVPSVTPLV